MINKKYLLALVCALTSSMAFYGCDDGDAVGSTHNTITKTAECTTNADCADKGDKTECSADGICVAPAVTPECTTNEDCADKGDKTECSSEGICVVPAVTPECTTNDDCADKGDKTECNTDGICVVPSVCDNGTLEDGEECDGLLIAENLDVDCGVNKQLVENPVCISGTCKIDLSQSCEEIQKECEVDDDCADKEDGRTKCDVENNVCVVPPECEVDEDCADKEDGRTKCDVGNGVCVVPPECEVDDDCAEKEDGRTKCDVDNGVCVVPPECESHADCADKEDGRTKCDVSQNTCYAPECDTDDACVNNTEGKTKCDVDNGLCVIPPECVADEDCAQNAEGKIKCDTEQGKCILPVECTSNADCAGREDGKTKCDTAKGVCIEPSVVVDPEKPLTYKECKYPDEDKDGISDEIEGKAENRDSDGDGIPDYQDLDSDNDTIPDSLEGGTKGCSSAAPIDSDRDDTPDYLDTDSDNNDILDAVECCGNGGACPKDANGLFTECLDTDKDSYADYADSDNDGDYISDKVEIEGMVNPKDTSLASDEFSGDCDKDSHPDKKGSVAAPIDCDKDGIPDYMDVDSDGDQITDADEGQGLVNGGKYYSHYMTDSDGDGIPDGTECGGTLSGGFYVNCLDSNGTGIPDYLELDGDSDGIPDSVEHILGSDPRKGDTDGDKTDDIIEYGICLENGTNCDDLASDAGKAKCKCPAMLDKDDDPVVRGDFVFVTPYLKKSSDPQTLSLETGIQTIDMFFIFDGSSSMSGERQSLRDSLPTVMKDLQCEELKKDNKSVDCTENKDCTDAGFTDSICSEKGKCITSPSYGEGCFDNMWTGVGAYNKIDTFVVAQHLTDNTDSTINTLKNYTWPDDDDEAPYSAVMCAALKKGENNDYCAHKKDTCSADSTKIGCAGFRKNAVRVILEAFDENQCYARQGPTSSYYIANKPKCETVKNNVGSVLKGKKIRYVGLWNQSWESNTAHFDDGWYNDQVASYIGTTSGSVDASNQPFVYNAVDSALADNAKAGIRKIASLMPMDITSSVEDIDANASQLVAKLEVNINTSGIVEAQGRKCSTIDASKVDKTNPQFEGVKELIPKVDNKKVVLCYDVIPVDNQSIFKPDDKVPKIYKARVKITGDDSVLNSGVAYFLVPPEFEKQ